MNQPPAGGATPPPQIIYIIRHGEKPADPSAVDPGQPPPAPVPPFGVDAQGVQDEHSLLPRGWQRSGALTVLFDPALGALQAGLQTPGVLLSPFYGDPDKTIAHRTYQTVQGLGDRLGVQIISTFAEGQEPDLAGNVVSNYSGVVLICWEHDHIPALASALPATPETVIPQAWTGDRFDVIWTFTLVPGSGPAQYTFGQIPQQLLSGDSDTVIPA
jgi:hypothetical protein